MVMLGLTGEWQGHQSAKGKLGTHLIIHPKEHYNDLLKRTPLSLYQAPAAPVTIKTYAACKAPVDPQGKMVAVRLASAL